MRARNREGDVGPQLAAELLARGREVVLRARGKSMSPLLRDGDLLELAPLTAPPRVGDVLAALSGDRLLVHRVVRVADCANRSIVELQGDALWSSDGWFECKISALKLSVRKQTAAAATADRARSNESSIIGRVISLQRDAAALGAWRLNGARARAWVALLPLVRLGAGVVRRASRQREPASIAPRSL